MKPYWKVVVGGTDISHDIQDCTVVRPLNAVDYANFIVSDLHGRNYLDNVAIFDGVDIYADWTGATTQIHNGVVEDITLGLDSKGGSILNVKTRGDARAFLLTHCNQNYGTESENPTIEDPDEILEDLIDNYVQKAFDDAANTGYTIENDTYINIRATPNITYLAGQMRNCFDLINEVTAIRQAEEGHSTASDQWFVDTAGAFHYKAVDESQTGWSHYWDSTTTAPTVTEGKNIGFYNFHKTARDFANKIVYIGQLRKPAWDILTESTTGWGTDNVTLTADPCGGAGEPPSVVVGTNALKAASGADGSVYFYYPAPSYWDFTKIGSEQNIPTLNFYLACDDISDAVAITVNLYESRGISFFSYVDNAAAASLQTALTEDLKWQHFSIPIGPYAEKAYEKVPGNVPAANTNWHWTNSDGNASWNAIDGIEFQFDGTAERDTIFIDDLHFSGSIIRIAQNNTSIASYNEIQRVLVDDTAHDDTMAEGTPGTTDTGTCAWLAKAELMKAQTLPVVGTVMFARGTETLLPGQVFHLHGRQVHRGSTYRIDDDFRAVKVTHNFNMQGFSTSVDVTDDILTSFPKSPMEQAALISKYTFLGNREAKNVKLGNVDTFAPFLTETYNS